MMMKLSKLAAAIFTLVLGVASMARAHKARPFSSLDQHEHYLTKRRSLRQGDDIFSHSDSGKGNGGSKKSKGSNGSTSGSSSSDQSPPTSAPTSLPSCPCFNGDDIDKQVEALQDSLCNTNTSAAVGLLGHRPNADSTFWIAHAGVFQVGSNESLRCQFIDETNGFNGALITSDELEACQNILLGSDMFAVNKNCTVV